MRGDGEIFVFLLILAMGLAISIAFALWVSGFPWEMHRVPDIALSVNVNKVASNEWEFTIYFYNKGAVAGSVIALEINDKLCSVKLTNYENRGEALELPGDELYLRPGEKATYILRSSDITNCDVVLSSGSYVKISVKTNCGTAHSALVQLP